ncbi:MAG: gluconokinase [Acidimicrobiales bacterium]
MIVVVTGVAGSGKTTVGRLLARRLGAAFVDADDEHDPAARAKMAAGRPLTDADRAPWLDRLNARLRAAAAAGTPLVLACSALAAEHRRRLAEGLSPPPRWVQLTGSPALLEARLAARRGHFFRPELLASQLELWSPEPGALTLDVSDSPDALAERAAAALRGGCGPAGG